MGPGRETSGRPAVFARLSEVVRTVTSEEMSEGESLAARARFLTALARHRRRRSASGMAWSAGILAAGAAAAHLVQPASTASGSEPRARGRGREPGNGYVSGGTSPTVRFPGNDGRGGPSVELTPESRGRVGGGLETEQARVVLEGGRATVHGASHPFHDVLIVAGPYAVTSRGAQFDVSWSGDAIEVHVAAGAVAVAGPVVSQGLTLHEGQSFVACEAAWELRCF